MILQDSDVDLKRDLTSKEANSTARFMCVCDTPQAMSEWSDSSGGKFYFGQL